MVDVFKCHLTPEVKSVILAVDTDIVVIATWRDGHTATSYRCCSEETF